MRWAILFLVVILMSMTISAIPDERNIIPETGIPDNIVPENGIPPNIPPLEDKIGQVSAEDKTAISESKEENYRLFFISAVIISCMAFITCIMYFYAIKRQYNE
jgi:hypothetical protein